MTAGPTPESPSEIYRKFNGEVRLENLQSYDSLDWWNMRSLSFCNGHELGQWWWIAKHYSGTDLCLRCSDCSINFKDCTQLLLFVVLCCLLAVLLGLSLSVLLCCMSQPWWPAHEAPDVLNRTTRELNAKAGVLERETSFPSSFSSERNIDARMANGLSFNYFLLFFLGQACQISLAFMWNFVILFCLVLFYKMGHSCCSKPI